MVDKEKPSVEDESWVDEFLEKMSRPSEVEKDFFAQRKALGLGVGMDEDGKLVYETPPDEKPKA